MYGKKSVLIILILFAGLIPQNSYAQKTIKGLILKENNPSYQNSVIISDPKKDIILNDYLINNLNFNANDLQQFNILLTKNLKKMDKSANFGENSYNQDDKRIYNVKLTRTPQKQDIVNKEITSKPKISEIVVINNLIKNGQFAQAEIKLDQMNKKDLAAKIEAAGLYELINKREKALKLYENIVSQAPSRIEFLYMYSLCLFKNSDNQKAINYLNSIIRINPDFMLAHYTLGNIYFIQKDYIKALKSFKTALVLNPLSADTSYNMALTLENLGYKTLAVKFYNNCFKLNPQDKEAFEAVKRLSIS